MYVLVDSILLTSVLTSLAELWVLVICGLGKERAQNTKKQNSKAYRTDHPS